MRKICFLPTLTFLTCSTFAFAQRGASDWMTTSNDAQRSSWVRSDRKISLENMRKPGFTLVWKMPLEGAQRQLTPPALLDFYIGYRGFRTLGFFGSTADRIVAVDTDLARVEWEKSFGSASAPAGTEQCPGGMTSAVARPTSVAYPSVLSARGFGRSGYAQSGVGGPYEGAVTLKITPAVRVPPRPAPPKSTRGADAVNPFAPHVEYVVALSGDGKLHSMWVSSGNEAKPPVSFIPPNAHALGLVVFNNTAYVATTNHCGGVENGVWSLDLTSNRVRHWKTSAESMAGTAGLAAGPDGTIYAAAGGDLVALAPETLEPVAIYHADGAQFTSTPVVFPFNGKNLIAITTGDGRLELFDSAALGRGGQPLDRSEPVSGRDNRPEALATWQDSTGDRWILVPVSAGAAPSAFESNGAVTNGAIAAWKVDLKEGAVRVVPGWISRDMVSPLPPIVINGVIFALSAGGASNNAVLYALDPATGKELWSSGSTIGSFATSGGLAAGGTRVYVATHDGTQYAFGFPIEH